jgi:hypothetical protein
LLTLDHLSDIIAQGEQLDVEFKSGRHNMAFYCRINNKVTEIEGNP